MRIVLCLLLFLSFFLPRIASAEMENKGILEAKVIIDSGEFLNESGMAKLQDVSSNLSPEVKYMLYSENEKNGILGCGLDVLVPSLGNWIIGDYTGAGVSDGLFVLGYIIMVVGSVQYNYNYNVGIDLVYVGVGLFLGSYIYGPVSSLIYADNYNHKLRIGLLLADECPVHDDNMAFKPVRLDTHSSSDIFRLNLISFAF
jgi:hypothetical protein